MPFKIAIILLILFSEINCANSRQNNNACNGKSDGYATDTFIVKTAKTDFVFKGKRIYPKSLDNNSFIEAKKIGVFLQLMEKDTLYIFVRKPILCTTSSIDDFFLSKHLPKFYDIEREDYPPYFINVSSLKDNFSITYNKKDSTYIYGQGIITDTLFNIDPKIKVGLTKSVFFQKKWISYI